MTGSVPPRIAIEPTGWALERRWRALLAYAIIVAVLAVAMLILFFFNPAVTSFYPYCWFHKVTGLLCPGCGSLRACHQMLHGNIGEAFHYNQLLVLSTPLILFWVTRWAMRKLQGRPARLEVRDRWLWILFVILVVFGVARNF